MLKFESVEELTEYIQKELLNTSEATELLQVSRQYISLLVANGKLTPVKESNRERLFWRKDLIEFGGRRHDKLRKNATDKK